MKKRTFSLILIAIVGIAVLAGIIYASKSMIIKKDKASALSREKLKNAKVLSGDEDHIDLVLYFGGNQDKAEVVKEDRLFSNEELLGEIIIRELIKGPAVVSGSKPVMPKETRLLSFSIKEGVGHINLSSEVMFDMTELQEETLLLSITNSLTEIDSIDKVMITVESQGVETLGGYFNISKPFSKDEIKNLKIQQ